MYQALALSYNLPVAYIVNTLGIDKAFEFGQKFGLDMENVEKVLGASIGSGVETNPLQMAQAYSAFANDGVMKDAHLITRIETASGKVLAQHRETSTKVIDRSVADKMTSMMLGILQEKREQPKQVLMSILLMTSGILLIHLIWLSVSGLVLNRRMRIITLIAVATGWLQQSSVQ